MAESSNVYILITSHLSAQLSVDLGQNFPPAQQLLGAHLEKMFACQSTYLTIDCTPTQFLTALQ